MKTNFDSFVRSIVEDGTRRHLISRFVAGAVALVAGTTALDLHEVDATSRKPRKCKRPKKWSCKRSVRRNGKCRLANKKNGVTCGKRGNGVCRKGKCGPRPNQDPCKNVTCTGGRVCRSGYCVCPLGGTCVTKVRSSTDIGGWFFYNDENDTIDHSLGSFVTGPGSPPNGVGSVQISVTGTQRRNIASYQFSGTSLEDIDELKYTTYNPSAGNGGSATRSGYLQFNVDFNGTDTWQRRLVFLPSDNGTIVQDNWNEWDAINGGAALWRYSGPTWPIDSLPGTTPKTWSAILLQYSGVRIRATDAFLGIRVGEPYADGYTENIDAFTFGTAVGITVFDFEP